MKTELFILVFFYLLIITKSVPVEDEKTILNIYYSKDFNNYTTNISKNIDEDAIAYAIYNKSYERTGWDFLSISTYDKKDKRYNDTDKAYAMGYLEGVLTKDRIYSYANNLIHYEFSKINFKIPDIIKQIFKKNIDYMKKKSLEKKDTDIKWENIYYIYQQLIGLYDGYMSVAEKEKQFEFEEFIILPSAADEIDIIKFIEKKNERPNFIEMKDEEIKRYFLLNSHCSALIKLADDFSDIWFGHNTWFNYNSMIRIFKEYRFISNKRNEKSKTVSFSSYPATLYSSDDFYYLDSNLLVMETTNSIFERNLYDLVNPEALLTWVRVILANRLASSAEEWTNIFKIENSGTYNNQ